MYYCGVITALLCFLISCGKNEFPDYSDEIIKEESSERNTEQSVYTFSFFPLNGDETLFNGKAIQDGDKLYLKVIMRNGLPRLRYQQYIYSGERCPSSQYLTYMDIRKYSGQILFPLDGSLISYQKGHESFPVSNRKGAYNYKRSTSIKLLEADLRRPAPYKHYLLKSKEKLNLQKRVIIIYGGAFDPLRPVACALINKTTPPMGH